MRLVELTASQLRLGDMIARSGQIIGTPRRDFATGTITVRVRRNGAEHVHTWRPSTPVMVERDR